MSSIKHTIIMILLMFSFVYSQKFSGDLACECGCKVNKMSSEFLTELKKLENKTGLKFHVTSGYRCRSYNNQVGGGKNSRHMYGMAVDIRYSNYYSKSKQLKKIVKHAKKSGYFTFVYDEIDHIHIDSTPGKYFSFKSEEENSIFSESLYAGYIVKSNSSSFFRLGYLSTNGDTSSNLYIDKLINSDDLSESLSFGLGAQIHVSSIINYIGFSISGGIATDYETDSNFHYMEPSISIGYMLDLVDLRIEISKASPINSENIEPSTNLSLNINFGAFKI